MKRVTGIGGIFFKTQDPQTLYQWYEKHLGIPPAAHGASATFEWRELDEPEAKGMTVWSISPTTQSISIPAPPPS
jgi:lactoylglutathione lyase